MPKLSTDLPPAGLAPSRRQIVIQPGAYVRRGNAAYRIAQVIDFNTVIGTDVETGRAASLPVAELAPADGPDELEIRKDLAEIDDKDWREAERRYAAIQPFVQRQRVGRRDVERRAGEVGVDAVTLYRWLRRYRATGSVLSLIPRARGWKAGKSRLSSDAEAIVDEVIRGFYLTPQRPTAQKAVIEILRRCHERRIDPPSPSAIRARINRIPEHDLLSSRGYRERAKNRFTPSAGAFPHADYPLAVVQIDHTPADIILVDDIHRKPIGRPWITLAIDVYSRMVAGYYLSFDPPSETSVALCVAHAILPKDEWLLRHKVDAQWPVWGVPRTIHVDNDADFRSENFRQSCLAYGINLEFRPVRQPRYGGHVERAIGSLLKEIHDLPGTTFSSVKDKEGYNPEKHAAMTKTEFEEWLVALICKVYHERLHAGIGTSPRRKWELGVFGDGKTPGTGLPPRPADPASLLLDFLPAFRRTVQTFGVRIDAMTYYAEALRPWINDRDPDGSGKKREFIFRRDPRDISAVWFRDPVIGQYFKIPFADQSLPPMSIWEVERAKERLRKEGCRSINQVQILRAVTELRSKVEESKEKTRKARRLAQRRREHEKKVSPAAPSAQPPPAPAPQEWAEGGVEPFEEIQ